MLTASYSSWTPGRPGGALRGVVDDITDRGSVKPREAEASMATIVAAIRDMEAAGELKLVAAED